jgi:hypothetical protein
MSNHYGYINKTRGRDGDEVDCFIGPLKNAKEVYVVHMRDMGPVPSEREDEDKCFIGFPSADAAKAAFLRHYRPDFYESMTAMPVALFKDKMAQASRPYTHTKIHAEGGRPGVYPRVRGTKPHAGVAISRKMDSAGPAKAVCPNCGSKKYGLMPTDFETKKCSVCGKIIPEIDAK